MINNYFAIIESNQSLNNMSQLLNNRPHPALPVGGRYRIIDFPLSNITNAGISNVLIIEPTENSVVLREHIASGESWDLNRKNSGARFIKKYSSHGDSSNIKDFERNLSLIDKSKEEYVLITNTSMIYNIDLKDVFKEHENCVDGRDATFIYKKVINDGSAKFYEATTMDIDSNGRVIQLGKNLLFSAEQNIFSETFIIKKSVLVNLIEKQIEKQEYKSLGELVVINFKSLKIGAYRYKGYLAQINSLKEYYDFNMDLLDEKNRQEILNNKRAIFTKRKDTPSTIYKKTCSVENSLLSNGCQISGTVKNSIIGRRVIIEEGAVVENCVILQNCVIKSGAHLRCVIADMDTVIDGSEVLHSSPVYPLVLERKSAFEKVFWKG